jgi:hypothetical protein
MERMKEIRCHELLPHLLVSISIYDLIKIRLRERDSLLSKYSRSASLFNRGFMSIIRTECIVSFIYTAMNWYGLVGNCVIGCVSNVCDSLGSNYGTAPEVVSQMAVRCSIVTRCDFLVGNCVTDCVSDDYVSLG